MLKKILFLFAIFFAFGLSAETKKKTICLNMIVKNESEVIERCLASVKQVIDYWVIFDTGSTDGTQEIIKKYLKGIPGELHQSKWVDFAHNRNEALNAAKGKGDYLLLIDADEIWQYCDDFALPSLTEDYYHVTVRQLGAADIKRIGLIKNELSWKWKGVLHEVLECSEAKSIGHLKGVMNICNAAVGARSKDPKKYLNDALILEKALKKEPKNSRYAFYMAQSYLNAEKYEEAIKGFEKRIAMESSDVQETYLAIYNKGMTHEKLNDFESALRCYFKAYEFRPTRAEPLFRIAVIYRKQGNYLLGYLLSKYALSIPCPVEDLCVEYLTYDHQLLIEYANCTLLSGRFQEGLQACLQLLSNPNLPPDIKPHVLANCELATNHLYGKKEAAPVTN
ncbi:MAG TPA: glycosyltransferase [Rhabdochlamydiaceae bacterium]|nr:glycosyltransferase [Rhabdochlamydiaceae bacterium]